MPAALAYVAGEVEWILHAGTLALTPDERSPLSTASPVAPSVGVVTLRPVEWDVLHPLDGQPLAIVRLVWLGPRREAYYRAVTANPERAARKLIGYWPTLDDAHTACLALYERATGRSLSAGNRPPSLTVPPQKPPPLEHREGMAARPRLHSARA